MPSMTIQRVKAALTLGVAVVGLVVAAGHSETPASSMAGLPRTAPAWKLKDLEGKTVQLADFKGKVVILDFWATWCPPCRAEIPGFVALAKKYGAQGLAVVGVALDQGGEGLVKRFVKEQGVNYPVVLGDDEVVKAFGGIEAIPTTFVLDRSGRIVSHHVGFTDRKEFVKEIKPLLKP